MRLLSSSNPVVGFAPADRFFFRVIPIVPGSPPVQQAELALEGLAPFPPAQLYWGCCIAPDGSRALVYAAHRRRFTAQEIAAWEKAELVVPNVLCLLRAEGREAVVRVIGNANELAGAAWAADGSGWPSVVQGRLVTGEPGDSAKQQFAAELAARAGIAGASVQFPSGSPRARREKDDLILELASENGNVASSITIPAAHVDALDVRDRVFLEKQRGERKRASLVWRVMLAGAAAAIIGLVLELSALGLRFAHGAKRSEVQARASVVQKLETMHSLTSRVDDLTNRRLRFFEMLAAVNAPRPGSIQFTRTGTTSRNSLEIEGQTSSANDVSSYEAALRRLDILEKVEMRVQGREGVTTFHLSVAFKEGAVPSPTRAATPPPGGEPAAPKGGAE